MSIQKNITTTYNAQSTGQVERYNRTIFAALSAYVADHSRDRELYTDVLTYACNCQRHTFPNVALLKLELSNPQGPISLKRLPSCEEAQGDLKRKWKHRLQDTMTNKKRLDKSQAPYKNKYDARLRKQLKVIQENNYVYFRVEGKNTNDHKHKLAPIAEDPYKLTKFDMNAIVFEKTDHSIEKLS